MPIETTDEIESVSVPSLPPLSSLINETSNELQPNVDLQWLLDFAILGHAKTATSFTHKWLDKSPALALHRNELKYLKDKNDRDWEDGKWAQQTWLMYNWAEQRDGETVFL